MLNFCLLPTEIFSKRRKIYAIWAEGLRYKLMNSLVWLTFSWAMPKQLEARLIFRQKTSRPDIATGLHDFETAFCENVSRVRGWKHKSIRENSSLPSPSWLWVTTSAISCFQKVLTVTNEWNLWSALTFLVNGHIMLNAPVLVRSPKLSSIEPRQYLDGWPPGNTGCCWQINFFSYTEILTRNSCFHVFFFIRETNEKNPQVNFSSQNLSDMTTFSCHFKILHLTIFGSSLIR